MYIVEILYRDSDIKGEVNVDSYGEAMELCELFSTNKCMKEAVIYEKKYISSTKFGEK